MPAGDAGLLADLAGQVAGARLLGVHLLVVAGRANICGLVSLVVVVVEHQWPKLGHGGDTALVA